MKLLITLLTACIACYASEPAIYSLTLSEQLTLDCKNIDMIPNMTLNEEITTPLGTTIFSTTSEGITVSKSGLYRVIVYQKTFSTTSDSSCIAVLSIGDFEKRYKVVNLGVPVDEINFTHVLRMNAGETLQLILRPSVGPIQLETGTESSGFIIEEIPSD